MGERLTTEEFIKRSIEIHGDRYDYSKVEVNGIDNKVIIGCSVHGDYLVRCRTHLHGRNCSKCVDRINAKRVSLKEDEVVRRCVEIWGDRFDYSEINYTKIVNKHKITCNVCGTTFYQSLNSHIKHKANGCPICRRDRGWKKSEWVEFCNNRGRLDPMVYIIRMFNSDEEFIKIGMTSTNIIERFKHSKLEYEWEVLKEIKGSPLFIYDKEIELHQKFSRFKYHPIHTFKGVSECFSLDILPLIDQIK